MECGKGNIQEVAAAAQLDISGGDYVEKGLGLTYGLALGAGILGSGGLLAGAFVVGFGLCALQYCLEN